jgi:hypothetical protein
MYMDVQVVALAHPCSSRHSGFLPIAAGRHGEGETVFTGIARVERLAWTTS